MRMPPTIIERAVAVNKPPAALIDQIVNLAHPAVTPATALMVERMRALRMSYMGQGRGREAHAVGRAALVVWHTIIATAGADELTVPTMPADRGPINLTPR